MTVTRTEASDRDLVAQVRAGDDSAFEDLYSRYRASIAAFVRSMLRDEARAEDVTQEVFLSALRRMRETGGELHFRPWIYEIARNAAIDAHRRTSGTVEVSMDAEAALRPSDRLRIEGGAQPESVLINKERLDHLRGALDELPDVQARILVMKDVEGLSYREIGERLDMRRPAIERTLVGARHRFKSEYEQVSEGRRCTASVGTIMRLADGAGASGDERRLARHAKRCSACRRLARELGIEPLRTRTVREKLAGLLPFSWGVSSSGGGTGLVGGLASHKAAALLAAVAVAGAGGAALEAGRDGGGGSGSDGSSAASQSSTGAPVERGAGQPGAGSSAGAGAKGRNGMNSGDRRSDTRRRDRERSGGGEVTQAPAPAPSGSGAAAPSPTGGSGQGQAPSAVPRVNATVPELRLPQVNIPQVPLPQVGQPAPGQTVPPVTLPPPVPPQVGDTVDGVRDGVNGLVP